MRGVSTDLLGIGESGSGFTSFQVNSVVVIVAWMLRISLVACRASRKVFLAIQRAYSDSILFRNYLFFLREFVFG